MGTKWVQRMLSVRTVNDYGKGTVCVIYARVSSNDQARNECSIPTQISDMYAWARERGWVVIREFVDEDSAYKGEGGRHREQLNEMLKYVEEQDGHIRYVLVHRLDRLARNTAYAGELRRILAAHKCGLHAVREPVEMETSSGRFATTLMFGQAEFFSDTLSKRTQEALRTRMADGWWVTNVPYGYRCVKKEGDKGSGRLVIHAQEAEVVRKVFAHFCEGWGRMKIVKKLNAELNALQNQADPPGLLSEDVVRSIRLRSLYTGVIYFGAKSQKLSPAEADTFENPEWRIVSDEVFQRAQNSLKPSFSENFRRRSEPCTLSGGFISCGYCGASCVRSASGFRCVKARNSQGCSARGVSQKMLDSIVRESLKQLLYHPTVAHAIESAWEQKQLAIRDSSAEKQLMEELAAQARVLESMKSCGLPEDLIEKSTQALKQKEQRLRARLALPIAPLETTVAHALAESLEGLPLAVARDLLRILKFRGQLKAKAFDVYVTLPEGLFSRGEKFPNLGSRGPLAPCGRV